MLLFFPLCLFIHIHETRVFFQRTFVELRRWVVSHFQRVAGHADGEGDEVARNEKEKRISQPIQLQNIVAVLLLKQNNDFNLFSPKLRFYYYAPLLRAYEQREGDSETKEGDKQWIIPLLDELFNRVKGTIHNGARRKKNSTHSQMKLTSFNLSARFFMRVIFFLFSGKKS